MCPPSRRLTLMASCSSAWPFSLAWEVKEVRLQTAAATGRGENLSPPSARLAACARSNFHQTRHATVIRSVKPPQPPLPQNRWTHGSYPLSETPPLLWNCGLDENVSGASTHILRQRKPSGVPGARKRRAGFVLIVKAFNWVNEGHRARHVAQRPLTRCEDTGIHAAIDPVQAAPP